jgi:uncharacterized protein
MKNKTRYDFDARKNASNKRKHGVDFPSIIGVFEDPFRRLEMEGTDHGEIRWRTTGEVLGVLFVVSHTLHEEGETEVVRIISARPATRSERRKFEEGT